MKKHTPLIPLSQPAGRHTRGDVSFPGSRLGWLIIKRLNSPLCVLDCVEVRGDARGVCFALFRALEVYRRLSLFAEMK